MCRIPRYRTRVINFVSPYTNRIHDLSVDDPFLKIIIWRLCDTNFWTAAGEQINVITYVVQSIPLYARYERMFDDISQAYPVFRILLQ